jgi:hypothetical protein|tara:strand:- start:9031 stop:9273 length:243 start_codon:yes stop_codon:yes gene_type:complete
MKSRVPSLSLVLIVPLCLLAGTVLMFAVLSVWGLIELGSAIRNILPSRNNAMSKNVNDGFEQREVIDVVWEDVPASQNRV